jgi:hypothetical protein
LPTLQKINSQFGNLCAPRSRLFELLLAAMPISD